MKKAKSGKMLAMVFVVLLAACADSATAPTSQLKQAGGLPSYLFISPLASVTPLTATVASGGTQQFVALNAFGLPFVSPVTWSVNGGGTIDAATGLFTAGATAGTFTVSASNALRTVTVTASVTVTVATPTCKPDDDDKKECDTEKDLEGNDHGDKDHGDKDHGDKDHGDKNHGDKNHGDKNHGDKNHGSGN